MAQSLRRSQFITTYGPGAILEGPDGPRVIPVLELSRLFNGQRRQSDFEIADQRLSQALLNGAGILRLPSNAELGMEESRVVYDTLPFPSWALCVSHNLLYHKTRNDNRACPRCESKANPQEAWQAVRRQAIRFVRSCRAGHLDDVDWNGIIDHRRRNCNPEYLLWQGGGGALRDINIVCPDCNARINLGVAYSRNWPCSGRLPERGNARPGCRNNSRILQRGAANLRIAELRTALTIPPRSTPLHRLLEISAIQSAIVAAQAIGFRISSKQQLLSIIQSLVDRDLVRPSVRTEIEIHDEPTILSAVNDVINSERIDSPLELRLQELEALRDAAVRGAPPRPSSTPGATDQFEVQRDLVRILPGSSGRQLRVTPVNRLRVVMVQTGYRRLDPTNPAVNCAHEDDQRRLWYPGVELFGEGIFIDLAPEDDSSFYQPHFQLTGAAANVWIDAWSNPEGFGQSAASEEREQLHPVFVWWHTLAHRLINALAVDSGYSSAAVRERIFVEVDENTGNASGGILLYTAQPGGDGTLGGLVALLPQFERVLDTALRDIDACSNDPLCSGEVFAPEKYNGAACYACALISETSCEHRNMRLDRNLLLDNLPLVL